MIEKMELDIGSLFYILITIIAVIAGIANKKKKKAVVGTGAVKTVEATDGKEGKSTKGGFFSKLEAQLERFATEAKQSIPGLQQEPLIKEEEVGVERDYFESKSDDYDKRQEPELLGNMAAAYEGLYSPDDLQNDPLMEAEGISATDAMEFTHLDEDQERSFEDQQIIEDFDIRTAIIYSTIINRIEI